ncbi:MAG: c-type cytochrome, partial [Phototrophicaceae bacterium]
MTQSRSLTRWAMLAALISLFALLTGVGLSPSVSQAQAEPTPRPLYALPDARNTRAAVSSSLTQSETTGLVVVVNLFSDTLSVVAPVAGELRAEIPVGDDPRSVAFLSDGVRAVVANRGESGLMVVDINLRGVTATIPLGGVWAQSVVVSNNDIAYVALQGSHEVVAVDVAERRVLYRVPTPDFPSGLALWGEFLYVTHLWSGEVSLIYLPQQRVVNTIPTGLDTGLAPTIALDITRGLAYVPQQRAFTANPSPTYDSTVFPVVNVLALSGLQVRREGRITLNTVDRPVNMPFALAVDASRSLAYVVNAGSNNLSIIDLNNGSGLANVGVGKNPRGIILNPDSTQAYVHNTIDGTLSVLDTRQRRITDTIPTTSSSVSVPVDVLIGAELFHSASDPRMSQVGWVSCASCHFDGMSDGQVWQGFAAEGRNTPALFDLPNSAPYGLAAEWNEVADSEIHLRQIQAGTGLLEGTPNAALGDPHAGLSLDLDTLVFYLDTLQCPASPYRADDPLAVQGQVIFEAQACANCHTLPLGTNGLAYDVGTGGTFDTPTLRWLWLSAPYYHDGRAQTLQAVFTQAGSHQLTNTVTIDQINALVAYLQTLPQ